MKRRDLLALGVVLAFLPAVAPVLTSVRHATYASLGRDQGIFQYIAWAVSRGEVDYRDVRDVNGPLIHLIHRLFLALGGRDEVRFHVLDFAFSAFSFFTVGALLPGISSRRVPRAEVTSPHSFPQRGSFPPRSSFPPPGSFPPRSMAPEDEKEGMFLIARTAVGLVAVLLFTAQYVKYIWWDLAQRESFCDWFLVPSVVLGVLATLPAATRGAAGKLAWAAGLLAATACFGKQTYVLYGVVSLIGLLFAPRERIGTVLVGYLLGGLVAASLFAFYLAFYGDLASFVGIYFRDAPRIYRFIWHRPARDIFEVPWGEKQHLQAGVTLLFGTVLILFRVLHARVLPILALPLVAYAGIVLQAKGFPYHFHPVSLGLAVAWLTIVTGLVDWLADEEGKSLSRSAGAFFLLLLGSSSLSLYARFRADRSSYQPAKWMAELGGKTRETRDFYDRFRIPDYFPWEMREAAAYLREVTKPEERVQTYGMDPYLLFLAEKKSATRFIYAYDLNYDTAIAGALDLLPPAEAAGRVAWIREKRDANERLFLGDLEKHAVGAFVFFDKAPLLSDENAVADFEAHSPDAFAWTNARFEPARSFGSIHVWLPKGRAPKEEASP